MPSAERGRRVEGAVPHEHLSDTLFEHGVPSVVPQVHWLFVVDLALGVLWINGHGPVGCDDDFEGMPAVVERVVPARFGACGQVVADMSWHALDSCLQRADGRVGYLVAPTHVNRRQLRALVQRREVGQPVAPTESQPLQRRALGQRCDACNGRGVAFVVATFEPSQLDQRAQRRQVAHVGAANVHFLQHASRQGRLGRQVSECVRTVQAQRRVRATPRRQICVYDRVGDQARVHAEHRHIQQREAVDRARVLDKGDKECGGDRRVVTYVQPTQSPTLQQWKQARYGLLSPVVGPTR